MKNRERRCQHPQLWVGYGLILAVIVLGVTAITSQFQHAAMRSVAAHQARQLSGQAREIVDLRASQSSARDRIQHLDAVNLQQDQSISTQRQDLQLQQQAIRRLAHLSHIDALALAGLRDELAARDAGDAHVRKRLEQLEHSNAAARAAINSATSDKGQP